jgi:hypothetical protein
MPTLSPKYFGVALVVAFLAIARLVKQLQCVAMNTASRESSFSETAVCLCMMSYDAVRAPSSL